MWSFCPTVSVPLKPAGSIYLRLPVDPSVPAFLLLSVKLKANELTSTHTALPKEFLSTPSPD